MSAQDKAMERVVAIFSKLTKRERLIAELAARTAYKAALHDAVKALVDMRSAAG